MPLPRRSSRFRQFLANESGGAVLLLIATVLALLWANLTGRYEGFWKTEVMIVVEGTATFTDGRRSAARAWPRRS